MSSFGVEHGLVSKAEKDIPASSGSPSGGRRLAHHVFGIYHTGATSRKGRRAKNIGRDIASGAAGAAPGAVLTTAGLVAAARGARDREYVGPSRPWGPVQGNAPYRVKSLMPRGSKVALPLVLGGAGLTAGGMALARQANLGAMNRKGYLKAEEKQR